MPQLISREPYVRQSISFRRSQLDEAKRIAVEEERHGNLSRYIQDLVDADIARRREAQERDAA